MNGNQIRDLIRYGVEQGQYPRYLYKYRVCDPIKNLYFDNIITDNSMMFSPPQAFNDPFDCQLQPLTTPTRNEILTFLQRIIPNSPVNIINNLADNATNNPNQFAQILRNAIRFNEKGILCLSQEADNILLWSHYSDNHYGACLKFDILEDLDFFSIPLTVLYDRNYPIYNHMTEPGEIVNKMIKTKYEDWRYEREIRIFKNAHGIYHFSKTALTEIIFGCNTPQTDIDRITNLATANGYNHLVFKKAEKTVGVYGLNFRIL
jgi:hypothetical protein